MISWLLEFRFDKEILKDESSISKYIMSAVHDNSTRKTRREQTRRGKLAAEQTRRKTNSPQSKLAAKQTRRKANSTRKV